MNKQGQLLLNIVLAVAVAVLFFLHFRSPERAADAAVGRAPAAPSAAPNAANQPAAVPAQAPEPAPADADTAARPTTATADVPAIRRVGYVKSGELLEGYKGMQTARAAYEAKVLRWEKEHQASVQAFQAAVQAYQVKAGSLLDGQRTEQEQKLQAQEQQLAQRQQQLQQQAAEEEGKLNEQILGRVNKILDRYGKAHDYDLILVAGNGSVAYGRPGLDLTKVILAQLNAEYAAGKK